MKLISKIPVFILVLSSIFIWGSSKEKVFSQLEEKIELGETSKNFEAMIRGHATKLLGNFNSLNDPHGRKKRALTKMTSERAENQYYLDYKNLLLENFSEEEIAALVSVHESEIFLKLKARGEFLKTDEGKSFSVGENKKKINSIYRDHSISRKKRELDELFTKATRVVKNYKKTIDQTQKMTIALIAQLMSSHPFQFLGVKIELDKSFAKARVAGEKNINKATAIRLLSFSLEEKKALVDLYTRPVVKKMIKLRDNFLLENMKAYFDCALS